RLNNYFTVERCLYFLLYSRRGFHISPLRDKVHKELDNNLQPGKAAKKAKEILTTLDNILKEE
ncbi:hypothetical protein COV93_03225, partial [Candidatus Woesearchaeota archaeon CG11_big_fil_rev_8_21_14_0_20_43_8]